MPTAAAADILRSPSMLRFPRERFLTCLCVTYAAAFASIRSQLRGLYGDDGLEPVDAFLRSLKQRDADLRDASWLQRLIHGYPTLVWLHEPLDWAPSFCMEVICLLGTTLALLAAFRPAWRTTGPLAVLWFCYLSIVQCGQTFLQFQWDSLLLEVGFLGLLLAPWWRSKTADRSFAPPSAVVWTLRFLFFKLMLMSGAVKIQSRCPTWLELSALDFHFASQPLPLPPSWFAIQAPPIVNRLAVAVTLLIEGPWTFFLLAPHPTLRRVGAVQQIALQLSILATGNYNFFNLLTIVLAAALLDTDEPTKATPKTRYSGLKKWMARVETTWHVFQTHTWATRALLACSLSYCVYTWLQVFEVTAETSPNLWDLLLATKIRLLPSVEDTQAWLSAILPRCVGFSAVTILFSGLWQLAGHAVSLSTRSARPKKRAVLGMVYVLATTVASLGVFTASTLTLSVLDRPYQQTLPDFVISAYTATHRYHLTSAYGLFRRMTGVGAVQLEDGRRISVVARPEIILEGTADGGQTWKAYHFQYKPGDVMIAPRLVTPFQPRLDWQMWFAALGDYHSAPWIVHLVAKLLNGSPDVKTLLDTTRDPFPNAPPEAVRAQLFYYDFTRLDTPWNRALPTSVILENGSDPRWWTRTFVKEYMPPLERGNPSLTAFVQKHWPAETSSFSASSGSLTAAEAENASQGILRMLEWLCRWPWAPMVLAASVLAATSGAAFIGRSTRHPHLSGKLKRA